ncbi:hypothetical protein VTK73DRAFT_8124 [Phialemonium thermophilum]|uniref:Uncharacterized protein n=1 Tax=Phialemonium thermophilum TaxID=223376 RepID=A0ABR3XQ79_9PEZI
MGIINAPNRVPEHQRFYQAAYRSHQRIWRINPRSKFLTTPVMIGIWGTTAFTLYGLGRKVLGYNSFFGE